MSSFYEIDWAAVATQEQQKKIQKFLEDHTGARVTGFLRNCMGEGSIRLYYSVPTAPTSERETGTRRGEWAEVTYGPRGGEKRFKSSWDERRAARQMAEVASMHGGEPRIVTDRLGRSFLKLGPEETR